MNSMKILVPGGEWSIVFEEGLFKTFYKAQEGRTQPRTLAASPMIWPISSLKKAFLRHYGGHASKAYPNGRVWLYPRYAKQLTVFRKFFWEHADRSVVSIVLRTYGFLSLQNYNEAAQRGYNVLEDFESQYGAFNWENWKFLRTKVRTLNARDFASFVKSVPEGRAAKDLWQPWKAKWVKNLLCNKWLWHYKCEPSAGNALHKKVVRRRQAVQHERKVWQGALYRSWFQKLEPVKQLLYPQPGHKDQCITFDALKTAAADYRKMPNWVKRLYRKYYQPDLHTQDHDDQAISAVIMESWANTMVGDICKYLGQTRVQQGFAELDQDSKWISFWQKHIKAFQENKQMMTVAGPVSLMQIYWQIQHQDISPGLGLKQTVENLFDRLMEEELKRKTAGKDLDKLFDKPFDLEVQDGWEATFLENGQALIKRGKEHRHCLAQYIDHAAAGQKSIWSLTSPDGQVGTAMFYNSEGRWCLDQFRGFGNQSMEMPDYRIVN